MDTTEKYIKMCEGAEEIQESHDFLKADGIPGIHINKEGDWYFGKAIAHNAMKNIWLPRQDQLQGMLLKDYDIYALTEKFASYVYHRFVLYDELDFTSLEQWWLAFVMKERYGKVWNDRSEEWNPKE